MSIGKNIAKYRKAKKLTQDALGVLLGVRNQAVSKWELEISLPDIMLLPEIAKVLDIKLDDLFANNEIAKEKEKSRVLDMAEVHVFPQKAQSMVIDSMYRSTNITNCNLWDILNVDKKTETNSYDGVKDNTTLCCLSHEKGAAYVSNDLTVIDSGVSIMEMYSFFDKIEVVSGMQKLTDPNAVRVLTCICREYFCAGTVCNVISLKIDAIADAAMLDTVQTFEAVEKLISLNIIQKETENKETVYLFTRAKITETVVIFRLIERLIRNQFGFSCGEFAGLISI